MAEPESSFDLAVLARLVGDDREAIADAVELFIRTGEAWRDDVSAAAGRGDADTLGRLGHRLKSSAAAIGAERLRHACQALETEADGARRPAALADAVQHAQHALALVLTGLAAETVRDQAIRSGSAKGRENR